MSELTIEWITLPFIIGFSVYLFPRVARQLTLASTVISAIYALPWLLGDMPLTLNFLGSFGVTLTIDTASGYFSLTNAIVTATVVLYCWTLGKSAYFFTQVVILHGCVNAIFICADLISLYVALEVVSIAAFLLISYPRTNRSIWVALRYLFISNTAMLFYLIGAVIVYQSQHSFAYTGLATAPPDGIALLFLGLLTKGGVFISGLWLPFTHSESDTPVSALLSGIVVKTGIFPLLRFAAIAPSVVPILQIFGAGTALLGSCYAIAARDTKRLLAFSTISQLGFILTAPQVGGFYALAHGLVKAALFLLAGSTLPSREFKVLRQTPIATTTWMALVITSLSISGFPLLAGFGAKVAVTKALLPWQGLVMNLAALGTATAFAKFIFLPYQNRGQGSQKAGVWVAIALPIGGLAIANGFYWQAYTVENVLKAIAIVGGGWLVHFAIARYLTFEP
ncbi:MAG: cation:proton antiporter, partial [Cyanobacteria bacterium J06641_5]